MATAGADMADMAGAWGMASARGITVAGVIPAITVGGDTPAITVDMEDMEATDMEATDTASRMGLHPRFIFSGRKHRVSRNLPIIGIIAGIRKGTTPT
jgi:hypothetical protein